MAQVLIYDNISKRNPLNEYQLIQNIGSGAYGNVFKAKRISTNKLAAIKVIKLKPGKDFAIIQQEVLTMKECCHPNIITFYKSYLRSDQLWICMEYCGGGSLQDIYLVTGPLTEQQIAYMCRETLRGLSYLHKMGKMHRDIKGANILLTETGDVKIADFGFSTQITATISKRKSFVGTPYWMAPEIVAAEKKGGYNQLCDIWACGIMAIELAELQPPMFNLPPMRALVNWAVDKFKPPTLVDTDKWSSTFHNFVKVTLKRNPEKRPTAEKLLQHPFFHRGLSKRLAIELLEKVNNLSQPIDLVSSDDDGGDLEVKIENLTDTDITNDQKESDLSEKTNNIHTKEQPLQNDQREYTCTQKGTLKTHKNKRSNKKPFKCNQCEYSSTRKSNLVRHKYIHTKKQRFQCNQCEYSSTRKSDLVRHKTKHSNERPFQCDQCERSYKHKDALRRHTLIHSNKWHFKCDQCEYSSTRKSGLIRHKYIHTKKQRFQCNQCEYSSTRKSDLVRHKYIHTKKQRFQCNQCEYSSTRKSDLVRHKYIHTKEQRFQCNQCEYSSTRKSDLVRHKYIHTKKQRFQCNQCEYSSTRKSDLVRHKYIHTKEQRFQCNQCEYSSTRKSDLVRHKYIHTKEQRFQCNQCEYSSTRKSDLVRHKYIHTKEQRFQCNQCEYSSTRKSDLVRHKYIHTKEQRFQCNQCEYSSTRKSDLVRHKTKTF